MALKSFRTLDEFFKSKNYRGDGGKNVAEVSDRISHFVIEIATNCNFEFSH